MVVLFNIIFIISFLILGVGAVMLILRNIVDLRELNKPTRTIQDLHPELENVQPGDELMTVNFGEEKEEEEDPLYKSLKNRINELNEELDDEDEDEDDDGDVVVRT